MQLEELTVQFLKSEGLLAGREEIQENLEKRIRDLEMELKHTKENFEKFDNEKCNLEELICVKEGVIENLTKSNKELEEKLMTIKINFEGTSNECKQLTLKIAKAKELLRRLKVERDELSERCKMFEKSEEIKNVGKNSLQMQEIGCVIGYSNDISSAPLMGENKTSVKNVFTENMCENKGEMENSERNYLQIQQTTTVISPLNDASSPPSTEHQITPVDTVVIESMSENNKETGNFESSNSQIHEASSVIPSLNDVFFPSAEEPKIIPNESALVLNTSENEVDFENIPPKRRKRDIAQIETNLFKKLTTLQKDKVDLKTNLNL
ncbi:hypothetical protein L9F63_001256 [Diploptera punctata]|uniref:Uncharacterized protein n=1 Tax=Diploptera punctata TaxID=6984 RepID=A0AAD8EIW2_DIPPU|nr:hypothetical protein L9F63_001256 [Diploptera punctata]